MGNYSETDCEGWESYSRDEESKPPLLAKGREKWGTPRFRVDNGLGILYIQFVLKETLWPN